jgi:hypothetical protein
MNTEPKDLFSLTESGFPPITLELSGIEVEWNEKGKKRILRGIPSFKTGKTAFGWIDKLTRKVQARPLTLPQHKKWMELAIRSIEFQLRSALGITDARIQTVASPRSWIASRVLLDDSWTWCREINITSRICADGEQEGATITIQRIA